MAKSKKKVTETPTAVMEHMETVPQQWQPGNLLERAVDKGVSLDQLERLIALQERWKANQAKEECLRAFAEFQRIAPDLKKNKTASFAHRDKPGNTSYDYQDLADITAHIRERLARCALSFNWGQKDSGNTIEVWCIISHTGGHVETGEPLSGSMDTSGSKQGIQAKASTITYLRRYTLTGMLGLSSADKDDDGKGGVQQQTKDGKREMTDAQFNATFKKVKAGDVTLEGVKEYYTLSEEQEEALKKAEPKAKA